MGLGALEDDSTDSRTELDSHANMPVLGRNAYVLDDTGRTASVSAYNPDYPAKTLRIIDGAVLYHHPHTGQVAVLVIRNALHVPTMRHNLIPPFIMREHGIVVNDVPKIQVDDPTVLDHALIVHESLRIPLSLHGTFSYFPTRKPTTEELLASDDIYLLTPEEFDPHKSAYAQNEDAMLTWDGDIHRPEDRTGLIVSDVDAVDITVCAVSAEENKLIDECLLEESAEPEFTGMDPILGSVSTVLCTPTLANRLAARQEVAHMMASIGSCHASTEPNLCDSRETSALPNTAEEDDGLFQLSSVTSLDELIDRLTKASDAGQLDLDELLVSSTYAKPSMGVKAAHLAKIWKIDLPTAERTLEATTQLRRVSGDPKLARNYGTNDRMLRYRRINQYFFMDTFFATKKGGKSSRGNTCCQLFVTDKGFVYVVPMKTKADVLDAIKRFAKEIGAPDAFVCDGAGEQTSLDLKRFLNSIGTTLRVLEQGTPWSNRAELYVGLMKEAVCRDMRSTGCPLAFWDYCVERRARVNNMTAKDSFKLDGKTPHEDIHGSKGDISNLCQFDFYDWCYCFQDKAAFPNDKQMLGRVLGPATGTGNEMCQWVLLGNGRVVARRTLRPLTVDERHSSEEETKRQIFDGLIKKFHGTPTSVDVKDEDSVEVEDSASEEEEEEKWEVYSSEEELAKPVPSMEDATDIHGRYINQQPAFDRLLNLELRLANGSVGFVKRRITNAEGLALGTYDNNPALNTMMYEVEFDDGAVREYGATAIAENILTQVDEDGFSSPILKSIVDYRVDKKRAVPLSQSSVNDQGRVRPRKTTKGWDLLVMWNDGTQSWIPLKYLKESNPIIPKVNFPKVKSISGLF